MTPRTALLGLASAAFLLVSTPAWADFRLERRLDLAPGGTFSLDAESASVDLTGGPGSGAAITITSSRDDIADRYDFEFTQRAGSARVTVKRKGSFFSNWGRSGMHIVIRVPRQTTVDLRTSGGSIQATTIGGAAQLRTSGGSLRLQDIGGDVDARTSGGSVNIRDVGGSADVTTSGGGIEVSSVRGSLRAHTSGGGVRIATVTGDVTAETSGGSVDIRGAGGRVDARTSGGPVTVEFARGNNRGGSLSSSGGGIRATIDRSVALTIDASCSGGAVTSDVDVTVHGSVTRNALRGDVNAGGPVLRMRTSGGGIRIVAGSGRSDRSGRSGRSGSGGSDRSGSGGSDRSGSEG